MTLLYRFLKSGAVTSIAGAAALLALTAGSQAAPAGNALSPDAMPRQVQQPGDVEQVRRRGRRGARRGARRHRFGGRKRSGGRRFRGRRFRGPSFVLPPVLPYYGGYYGSGYYPDYYYDPPVYSPPVYAPPRSYGGSCRRWSRQCSANWGHGNSDYWGCMRYHGCD